MPQVRAQMKIQILSAVILVLAGTACGKIPSEYRGKFGETSGEVLLELQSQGGVWTRKGALPNGENEVREFEAKALEFESLARGEAGIYLRSIDAGAGSDEELEVFWVDPDRSSLRDDYGFISMRARVIYTRILASPKSEVQSLTIRVCESGQVLVDRVSRSFNGGCPGDSRLVTLSRIRE
ncbi:MAG: hypothetical protein ACK5QT_00315 [Oligoflexia bacterium]